MVHVLSWDSSILGIETKGILGIETESEANLSYLRKPSQHSPYQEKKGGDEKERENRQLGGKYGIGHIPRPKRRANKVQWRF